ncbi:hypothetical protein AAHE18_06G153400 [Arachis hypogaea]
MLFSTKKNLTHSSGSTCELSSTLRLHKLTKHSTSALNVNTAVAILVKLSTGLQNSLHLPSMILAHNNFNKSTPSTFLTIYLNSIAASHSKVPVKLTGIRENFPIV